MNESYIIIKLAKGQQETLIKSFKKIIKDAFSYSSLNDEELLFTFSKGKDSLAIIKASFQALTIDCGDTLKGIIVPSKSNLFYSYIDLVPNGELLNVYELASTHEEIYDDCQPLLNQFNDEILDTVVAYIENDHSPLLSSYCLYVHRNTVTYRINLFEHRSSISLDNFSSSMFVYFLIKRHKILYNKEK